MTSRREDKKSSRREGWLRNHRSAGEYPRRISSEWQVKSQARQRRYDVQEGEVSSAISHREDRSMEGYDEGSMRRVV
jgi:hypothetical protein